MTSESVVGMAWALTADPSASPRGKLLEEEGYPIGPLHQRFADICPEPGRAREVLEHRAGFLIAQPVELELGLGQHVWVVDDLRPGAHHHEHRRSTHPR